jgi:hypothetical protein
MVIAHPESPIRKLLAGKQTFWLGLVLDPHTASTANVPEANRIPPAPDASALTLPARTPAQVAVRTLIVRLMSYCTRKPIS